MTDEGRRYSSTFTISARHELEPALGREAARAMAVARPQGAGLIVTRHDARTFTVEMSPAVPPGVIHEKDLSA
jgi:hypothetical protein